MKKYVLVLLGLCLFLIVLWFSPRRLLAGGEEGFSLFSSISLREQISLWQISGTGYPMPVYITRVFPVLLVKIFTNFGILKVVTQAVFFLILLLTGSLGMFFLVSSLLKRHEARYLVAFLSGMFYLLNLYVFSQVIGRFLYAGYSLWAYLPIFCYLWLQWVMERGRKHLLLFLASSVLYSVIYLQPAHIITLWAPAGLWSMFEVFKNRGSTEGGLTIIIASFIAFLLWAVFNLWWIYPYLKIGGSAFSEISGWQKNFNSLKGVSRFFPTYQILLLRQGFILGDLKFKGDHVGHSLPYGGWYNHWWVWGISIGILVVVLLGILVSRKNRYWVYLIGLFLLGWLVSKGTNPPFGGTFFRFLFSNFSFTQVLRNPYEKFGLVFVLPYSIFFGSGLEFVYRKLRPKLREVAVGGVLVLSCGFLVWPMWTGDVFAQNIRVWVPDYYQQANEFLNRDKSDGRVLMLPIIPGDGVRYSWGYQGVEPSEFLFDKPAVSKILRTKYFDEKYRNLYESFVQGKNYSRLLEEMNIKYLILHSDLDSEVCGASSSAEVLEKLQTNPKIRFLEKFGNLAIYENTENKEAKLFVAEGEEIPEVTYQRLSSTRYKVYIRKAKKPYHLIFKETFNDFWEARINGEKLNAHFLAYDYANGWRVEKKDDYTIEVVFKVWPWE